MKKLKYLIIIMLLFVGIKNIQAISNFDNTIKVYDYAQVLNEEEENKLKSEIKNYIDSYNIDMVLITIKYYNQDSLQNYMNEFYIRNNFGMGNDKAGIMIAVDFKNNNEALDIKTFGLASSLYSENEIKNILNIIDKEDNYYQKFSEFIKYSNNYVNEFDNTHIPSIVHKTSINWCGIIIPSIIVPTIVIIIGIIKNKGIRKKDDANYYIKEGSFVINKSEDNFITTNTKKERISSK